MFLEKVVPDYDVIHETVAKTIDELFLYLRDAKEIKCHEYDLHDKNENRILGNILFLTFNIASYYDGVLIDMNECCEDKPIGLVDLSSCDKFFLLSHVGNESNFVDNKIISLNSLDKSLPDKEAFQILLHTEKEAIDGYTYQTFIKALYNAIKKYVTQKSFLDDYVMPE